MAREAPRWATMVEALGALAGERRRGFAFVAADGGERFVSYAELWADAGRRGGALRERGLRRGDAVGLLLPEPGQFVPCFLGALRAGVVPVGIVPFLHAGGIDAFLRTAGSMLTTARARLLVVPEHLRGVVEPLRVRVPTLEHVEPFDAIAVGARHADLELGPASPDDVAFVQFTSGSTGTPRGIPVLHRNLVHNLHAIARVVQSVLRGDEHHTAVSWLPLYHDMGLVGMILTPIWIAADAVLMSPRHFLRRPTRWMELIHRHRATISYAPNFAYGLVTRRTPPEAVEELDLRCVRILGCGGEPVHATTLRRFLEHFAPAGLSSRTPLTSYGLAEHTLAASFAEPGAPLRVDRIDARAFRDEAAARPSGDDGALEIVSCGRALPDHAIEIVDDRGAILEERRVGRIRLRGPSVAAGYLGDSRASAPVFSRKGLYGGDLGYLAGGQLFVTGRSKEVVILNGRNHDPQTIEWAAAEVPGVRPDACVAFSVPGADSEALVIAAELNRGGDRTAVEGALRSHLRGALGLQVEAVSLVRGGHLPRTSSGKLRRREARERYLAGVPPFAPTTSPDNGGRR